MMRKGTWKIFASGLAGPYVVSGRSLGCPRRPSRICASWTGLTLAGSNGVNGTWRWSISRKLPKRFGFPLHNFSGVYDRLALIVPGSVQ